jgi:hypothetical protein
MELTGYIIVGMLVFAYAVAKGAARFNLSPRWLRGLIIDQRKS